MRQCTRSRCSSYYKHHRGPRTSKSSKECSNISMANINPVHSQVSYQSSEYRPIDMELLQEREYERMLQQLERNQSLGFQQPPRIGLMSVLGRACTAVNRLVGEFIQQVKHTDQEADLMNIGFDQKVYDMNRKFNKDLATYRMENASRNGSFIKDKKNPSQKSVFDSLTRRDFGLQKMDKFHKVDFISDGTKPPKQSKAPKAAFVKNVMQSGLLGSFAKNYGKYSMAATFFKKPTKDCMGNRVAGNSLFGSLFVSKPQMNFNCKGPNIFSGNPLLGITKL